MIEPAAFEPPVPTNPLEIGMALEPDADAGIEGIEFIEFIECIDDRSMALLCGEASRTRLRRAELIEASIAWRIGRIRSAAFFWGGVFMIHRTPLRDEHRPLLSPGCVQAGLFRTVFPLPHA